MTRQNKIHKAICRWEIERKELLKAIRRKYPIAKRSRKNRKFFRQLDKYKFEEYDRDEVLVL